MRFLIVLIILVVLMVIGGWLVIDFTDNSAKVEVQTDKIMQDTSEAVEQVSENFKKAGEAISQP
jgi:Na+-transporting methylmalonyl-CoA/oxaloacetate decarboxylase gamma subunit